MISLAMPPLFSNRRTSSQHQHQHQHQQKPWWSWLSALPLHRIDESPVLKTAIFLACGLAFDRFYKQVQHCCTQVLAKRQRNATGD
jgi:hypothetical protein